MIQDFNLFVYYCVIIILLIARIQVEKEHGGKYTCTPFNELGTEGASTPMDVIVQHPPKLIVVPKVLYFRKLGDNITMPCEAENFDNRGPAIVWQKVLHIMHNIIWFYFHFVIISQCSRNSEIRGPLKWLTLYQPPLHCPSRHHIQCLITSTWSYPKKRNGHQAAVCKKLVNLKSLTDYISSYICVQYHFLLTNNLFQQLGVAYCLLLVAQYD